MTLIALFQNDGGFECYADSLVSLKQGLGLDTYCKVLVLPVRYRTTNDGKTRTSDYKFGMALAGNLAAATAVYTVLCGITQSLHSYDTEQPPKDIDFVNLALKIARDVYENVRSLGEGGLFGFFMFGHDIATKKPFAVKISTEITGTGVYEVVPRRCNIGVDQVSLLGSGSGAFEHVIRENQGKGTPFHDLFFDFVRSGKSPNVGGLPQVLVAVENDVTIEPVLIGEDDGSNCKIYHSGMEIDGYKSVGDYMVGLQLKGFNMGARNRYQALKDEGYNPEDPNLSVGQENQSTLQWLLKVYSRQKAPIPTVGTATVSKPLKLISSLYLSYRCTNCGEYLPLFRYVSGMLPRPFSDELTLTMDCGICGGQLTVKANSYKTKYVKENELS